MALPGAKQDPNLKNMPEARVYNLIEKESSVDKWSKAEEIRARVVPLSADPRAEAKALLRELQLDVFNLSF